MLPKTASEPVIVSDTKPTSLEKKDRFIFYDHMFPSVVVDPKYALDDPKQVLVHPHFSTTEVARCFLGKNNDWIRSKINRLFLDGRPLEFKHLAHGRKQHKDARGERRLTIADCERLIWAMYQRGTFDGAALTRSMKVLVAVAAQYGVAVSQEDLA